MLFQVGDGTEGILHVVDHQALIAVTDGGFNGGFHLWVGLEEIRDKGVKAGQVGVSLRCGLPNESLDSIIIALHVLLKFLQGFQPGTFLTDLLPKL